MYVYGGVCIHCNYALLYIVQANCNQLTYTHQAVHGRNIQHVPYTPRPLLSMAYYAVKYGLLRC